MAVGERCDGSLQSRAAHGSPTAEGGDSCEDALRGPTTAEFDGRITATVRLSHYFSQVNATGPFR